LAGKTKNKKREKRTTTLGGGFPRYKEECGPCDTALNKMEEESSGVVKKATLFKRVKNLHKRYFNTLEKDGTDEIDEESHTDDFVAFSLFSKDSEGGFLSYFISIEDGFTEFETLPERINDFPIDNPRIGQLRWFSFASEAQLKIIYSWEGNKWERGKFADDSIVSIVTRGLGLTQEQHSISASASSSDH